MDIRVEDNNLLDYSDWSTDLSGNTVNFLEYVDKSYNYRVFDSDPFGNIIPIWKTTSSGLSGWTGGIVAAPSVCGVNIDNTKMYRFSIWTKRKIKGTNGSFYFGVRSLNNCVQDNLIKINDGLVSKNYYLFNANYSDLNTAMPEDTWILVVGYILPSTYTGVTDANYYGKTYNIDGVNTETLPYNYKWSGTTTAVYLRTYPYNETSLSAVTYFCYPRIDLVDGTEPSIATLLKNEGMWRSGTTYIKVEDKNLLDYSDWVTNITGSTLMFNNNGGTTSKNYIEINNDPFNNNYVWNSTIQSGATAHSSAGWNTDNIIIEPGVNYRYSQWVKRKNNSVSRVYFGCAAYGSDNKSRYLKWAKTGIIDTGYGGPIYNLNFTSSNWLPNEQWVLINYAILNSGSTTGSTLSSTGIWNSDGTKTSAIFNDMMVTSGTTQIQLRYYGPYVTTTGATHFQASYPRIDILDGTEPSINTLLTNEGMWRSGTTMIYVDDVWKNT